MKYIFLKFAPIILVTLGILLWGVGYLLVKYANITNTVIWSTYFIIQLICGLFCGIMIRKLHQNSCKDVLTGLSNRRFFYEKLAYEIEVMKRTKSPICLALIDIDDFKRINDEFGHLEGDRVLQQLATLLNNNVRRIDNVARWGGEEFAVILPNTNIQGAVTVVERLRKTIEDYPFSSKITISIGLAAAKEKIEVDKFVQIADEVLYKAKEKKNLVLSIEVD
jgi:diguanylate cyclase (GGDEF)-like protein